MEHSQGEATVCAQAAIPVQPRKRHAFLSGIDELFLCGQYIAATDAGCPVQGRSRSADGFRFPAKPWLPGGTTLAERAAYRLLN